MRPYAFKLMKLALISLFSCHWITSLQFLVLRITLGTPLDKENRMNSSDKSWASDFELFESTQCKWIYFCYFNQYYLNYLL